MMTRYGDDRGWKDEHIQPCPTRDSNPRPHGPRPLRHYCLAISATGRRNQVCWRLPRHNHREHSFTSLREIWMQSSSAEWSSPPATSSVKPVLSDNNGFREKECAVCRLMEVMTVWKPDSWSIFTFSPLLSKKRNKVIVRRKSANFRQKSYCPGIEKFDKSCTYVQ